MDDVFRVTEEDRQRAQLYGLLARTLATAPDETFRKTLAELNGDDTALGKSFAALSHAAENMSVADIDHEYSKLFFGMGQGGEVLPYASYYLTGSLNDKPLLRLRADMERLGIVHGGLNGEPEDHIAFVMEMMHGLILGNFAAGPIDLGEQSSFYENHIAPWAPDFFNDLRKAESSRFYEAVADLGSAFMAIEGDAFRMAA